jgi:hypothetical protein
MKDNQKMLTLLAELAGRFIATHGGNSNGYDTYLAGTIKPNQIGGITELNTPETFHMTINRVRGLCDEFEREVKKLVALYEFEKTIVFSYKYVNDGCYSQLISITDTIAFTIPSNSDEKIMIFHPKP